MVPSPKVATYDLQPEMNAAGVAEDMAKVICIFCQKRIFMCIDVYVCMCNVYISHNSRTIERDPHLTHVTTPDNHRPAPSSSL